MTYINNRLNYRRSNRPKAFWGAFAPAAINFVGGLITSSQQSRAQKRAIEEQKRLAQQQLDISNQNNLAATLNNYADTQNSYDNTNYNLKYRNGGTRRLGSNNIVITDGGNARRIGNDTFLLRGGSHEDINETGQTGIGINVGGNEIEAEGGEVAQKKNNSVRIFSAQPMLAGGLSPAQAILRGYSKDKVFAAQERFKRNNHLTDDGGKERHGTAVPHARIHINEDGTFTDTLTGKTYDTSATNGEDVVITGKANHWKEAGKHDTSRYFDPMGAVTFASAAGAPILNFSPSNIIGSIREAKDYNSFMNSFMNNNNGGFFDKDYAEKHPYISFLGNMIGDGVAGALGNKGIDLVRGRMNYAPYRKLTYKVNKLAKQTGLWRPNPYKIDRGYFRNYVIRGVNDYGRALYRRFPDKYSKQIGSNEELKILSNYYKNNSGIPEELLDAFIKHETPERMNRIRRLYNNNPEYFHFVSTNHKTSDPLNQAIVDAFLERQGRSIRGVHSDNLEDAINHLTTTKKGRFMSGGDRLDTNGGLYTSNSNDIANRFKNPEVGQSNGYVGRLKYNFNVDRTKPIEDQLYQARSQVYFDPTQSDRGFLHPFTYNQTARNLVRSNPNIKAIEANYGRRTGAFLNSNERAYLPSKTAKHGEVETPISLESVDEYIGAKNKRGRWGAGNTSDDLFISQTPNNTTDFIRDARILLSKTKDIEKISRANKVEQLKRINRFREANYLRSNTRYGKYNSVPISISNYLYNKASDAIDKRILDYKVGKNEAGRLAGIINATNRKVGRKYIDNLTSGFTKTPFIDAITSQYPKLNKVREALSPSYRRFRQAGYYSFEDYDNIQKSIDNGYDDYMRRMYDDTEYDPYDLLYGDESLPFRLGGKVNKLRLGGRTKAKWGTDDFIDAAKTIGSYLPIVGTIEDGYNFYKNPTLENAGWLALGAVGDIFGGRAIVKGVRALRNINRMKAVANIIPRLATRYAVQRQLHNGSKQAIRNIAKGTVAADDQVLQDIVDRIKHRNGGKVKYYKPNYYHWMHQTSDNLKVTPIDDTYDYRGYYDSATPWELANTMYNAKNGHFTDVGKRPSHPTFSNESKYSNSKTPGGTWNGNVFIPAIWQFGNNGNKIRNRYMNNTGEGYFDGRRNVYPKYRIGGRVKAKDGLLQKLYTASTGKELGKSSYYRSYDGKYYPRANNATVNKDGSFRSGDFIIDKEGKRIVSPLGLQQVSPEFALLSGLRGLGNMKPILSSKTRDMINLVGLPGASSVMIPYVTIGLGNAVDHYLFNNEKKDKSNNVSPYIARPNTKQTNNQTRKDTVTQLPDSIRRPVAKKDSVVTPVFKQALGKDSVRRDSVKPTRTVTKPQQKVAPVKQDTTRVDTTRQVKTVPQQKKVVTPQYKGNVTKGNYQLHDGESKVINGVKYTRIGNNIFNHKTNVSYVYDKNGNYTGQADYSKVGKNFNDAFDAARAAGRSNFIYNAGKYRNYSTVKEEDAKKEARNRAVGLKRIAKKCGGIVTPRRRYVGGGPANPWDKYKVQDYGGVSPWQISNKYDITYPYAITKYDLPIVNVTANRNNFSNEVIKKVKAAPQTTPSSSTIDTPYLGRHSSFKPATQDYIGLGIDTLAALGSGIFTRNAYNKLNFDYNLPSYVDESPVAFDTTYHNEAQRANVERNRINGRNLIQGNTASAQTALSRMQEGDTNAMMELNKLADEKSNKEVELRNQNAANEQQVRARNAAARNQYYQNVAQIQNAALEAKNNAALAKAQSIGTDLSGLAQAWSNFATSVENRYDSRQNQIAMVAKANNPTVTQTALKMGYDFSPETLAGLYNTTDDANLKRLILGRLSTRDRIKYGIQ